MKQEQPVFQIGDSVVVKEGVQDPDNDEIEIGGWQGRIAEIAQEEDDQPLFLVQWDGPTLRGMPPQFIAENLIDDLDITSMYLGPEVLSPAAPRDTPEETEDALLEVAEKLLGQVLPPEVQEAITGYTRIREALRVVHNEAMHSVTQEELNRAAKQLRIMRGEETFIVDSEDEMAALMDFSLYELRREGVPIIQCYLRDNPVPKKESGLGHTIAGALGSLLGKDEAPPIDAYVLGEIQEAVHQSFTSLFQVDQLAPEGLILVDLLDSKRPLYRVMDIGLMSTAEPRLLIFARLLPFSEYHITSGASFCYPPFRQEQLLRSYRSAVKEKRGRRVDVERFRCFHRANRRFGLEMVYE